MKEATWNLQPPTHVSISLWLLWTVCGKSTSGGCCLRMIYCKHEEQTKVSLLFSRPWRRRGTTSRKRLWIRLFGSWWPRGSKFPERSGKQGLFAPRRTDSSTNIFLQMAFRRMFLQGPKNWKTCLLEKCHKRSKPHAVGQCTMWSRSCSVSLRALTGRSEMTLCTAQRVSPIVPSVGAGAFAARFCCVGGLITWWCCWMCRAGDSAALVSCFLLFGFV